MRFGSVCSGIEAASVAWRPIGWKAAWLAEIEKFPSEVLQHHYPDVLNLGDMTKLVPRILSGEIEAPDVLVGGTPCQAFSIAGLRQSLEDDRGQLSLTYIHILDAIDISRRARGGEPVIGVWENVPGVLSTKDNAFGCFLAGMVGEETPLVPAGKRWTNSGYIIGPERTVAWRVLDAQYFGVAQRRKRVFVVASARAGFNPAKVLFESEGVRRDTPPSREKREEIAGTARTSFAGGGGGSEGLITWPADIAPTLNAHFGEKQGLEDQHINGGAGLFVPVAYGTQDPCVSDIAFAQGRNSGGENVVLFRATGRCSYHQDNIAEALRSVMAKQTDVDLVQNYMQVRRLTPVECERLQGFPDDYTNIKPNCPDGPRYKALGNSMAVPVMRWIGERIQSTLQGAK